MFTVAVKGLHVYRACQKRVRARGQGRVMTSGIAQDPLAPVTRGSDGFVLSLKWT